MYQYGFILKYVKIIYFFIFLNYFLYYYINKIKKKLNFFKNTFKNIMPNITCQILLAVSFYQLLVGFLADLKLHLLDLCLLGVECVHQWTTDYFYFLLEFNYLYILKLFLKKIIFLFFYFKLIFLVFLYYFDVLMSKIIFKK